MTRKTNLQAVLPNLDGTATIQMFSVDSARAEWLASLEVGQAVMREMEFQNGFGRFQKARFRGLITKIGEHYFTCDVWVSERPTSMKFRRDTGQHIEGQFFGKLVAVDR